MWTSYHIYNSYYKDFMNNLNKIKGSILNGRGSLFYTIYGDFKGPHYRLRLNLQDFEKEKIIEKELNNYFLLSNVEKRIYDPEIIKYGQNIDNYEQFSVIMCEHILSEKIFNMNSVERLSILINIIIKVMKKFDCFDDFQIEKSISYWKRCRRFYSGSITRSTFSKIKEFNNDCSFLLSPITKMERLPIFERRKLCFNYIHLTINRFNFNIKDECLLYYKIYEIEKGG